MMRAWSVLGLLAALAACGQGPAEQAASIPQGPVEWTVTAHPEKNEIQVGETLNLELTVRHPADAEFLIATGENLAPFELVERVDAEPASPVESRLTLRIAAYRLPGDVTIPPIKVEYRNGSGELASLETAPIPITLVTSLTPEVTDIHDIKDPIADIPIPWEWGRLWWLLGGLLAAALAYLLYRRFWGKKPQVVSVSLSAPLPPPEVEAEAALRRLVEAKFLEKGQLRRFYIELAEIMKRYAGRRFGVPFRERTTAEIQKDLRRAGLPAGEKDRLDRILVTSDFVKFARILPPEEESNRMVPEAFRFIEETKRKPPPPPEVSEPVGSRGEARR